MTSATAPSLTLVLSSLDHPDARTLADQVDGELVSIDGGPTTGRDTFSRINGTLDGQIMAFFVMVVTAAEVVVGLAITMAIFKTRRSASVDDASLLKY